MSNTKIDKSKLLTIRTYADRQGVSTQYVYRLIKEGQLPSEEIDGVKFVVIKK